MTCAVLPEAETFSCTTPGRVLMEYVPYLVGGNAKERNLADAGGAYRT